MFSIRDNAFLEVSAQLQINPTVEVNPLILQQLFLQNINCRNHKRFGLKVDTNNQNILFAFMNVS